jgi:hypothetical protein
MKDHRTSHTGASTGVQTRCGTNPPHRILVVDGDLNIHQSSAEVPIRHETNSLVKYTPAKRSQIQARNAGLDSLPVRL